MITPRMIFSINNALYRMRRAGCWFRRDRRSGGKEGQPLVLAFNQRLTLTRRKSLPSIRTGDDMTRLLKALLRDTAGFSAIEYGLVAAVTLVLFGQLFSRFWPSPRVPTLV
jgi:hypothetical protein